MPTSHTGVALLGVAVVAVVADVDVNASVSGRARNFGRVHDRMTERRWNVVEPQSLQVFERKRSSKRSKSVICKERANDRNLFSSLEQKILSWTKVFTS